MENKIGKLWNRIKGHSITKNYIWVFLGQNIGSVFSMLSLMITLRLISAEKYGALVVIQTYCLLIANIFGLRTFNGIIKYITQQDAKGDVRLAQKYINTAFLLDGIAGVVAFVAGFFLLDTVRMLMGWEAETVRSVNMYLPVVLFAPIKGGASVGMLRKLDHFKQVNLLHATVYGIQTGTLCLALCLKLTDFRLIIAIYMLTELAECLCLLIMSLYVLQKKSKYAGFWKQGFSGDRSFISYNIFYGLTSTFDQLLGNVSTLLINRFAGNFTTAYIKVITQICSVFSKLTSPFSQIFYPELCRWVANKQYCRAKKVANQYFLIVAGIGSGIVLLMTVTFQWWIVLFDASMAAAKWQSLLYMVYTLLSVAIVCINQLTFALDLVKENLALVIIFDLLYLALLIPSINTWGVYGYLVLQIAQLLAVVGGKHIFITRKIKKLAASVQTE